MLAGDWRATKEMGSGGLLGLRATLIFGPDVRRRARQSHLLIRAHQGGADPMYSPHSAGAF